MIDSGVQNRPMGKHKKVEREEEGEIGKKQRKRKRIERTYHFDLVFLHTKPPILGEYQ